MGFFAFSPFLCCFKDGVGRWGRGLPKKPLISSGNGVKTLAESWDSGNLVLWGPHGFPPPCERGDLCPELPVSAKCRVQKQGEKVKGDGKKYSINLNFTRDKILQLKLFCLAGLRAGTWGRFWGWK